MQGCALSHCIPPPMACITYGYEHEVFISPRVQQRYLLDSDTVGGAMGQKGQLSLSVGHYIISCSGGGFEQGYNIIIIMMRFLILAPSI